MMGISVMKELKDRFLFLEIRQTKSQLKSCVNYCIEYFSKVS